LLLTSLLFKNSIFETTGSPLARRSRLRRDTTTLPSGSRPAVWKDSAGSTPTGTTEQFYEDLDLVVDDEEPEEGRALGAPEALAPQDMVTESQKALVKKLHENTGRPPLERFLRTLRAAGALPRALKYVKDEFRCDTCAIKRGPDHRRKAQCPRVFSFNRVLSMDVFYVDFKGVKEAVLNMVDHGTNYQIAQRIPGTGRITHVPRDLAHELESGQGIATNLDELDELLTSLVAAKNRWFNAGGYTPTQLVFGELPRVPGELLADNSIGLQVPSDAYHDPAGLDEAGAEFRRRNEIRERAKQLALAETSKEALHRAVRTSSTPVRTWIPGQWVYCFRKGKPGDLLHPVSRWVGPGVVVLQTPSMVWVAMRTRLWRCSPEQLRPAFPSEVLGRQLASDPSHGELLRKIVSGAQTGAVDVAREGPPTEGSSPAWSISPLERRYPLKGKRLPPLQHRPTLLDLFQHFKKFLLFCLVYYHKLRYLMTLQN
ncbi:unnamed protein product, partial [Symbiodinium pilosum]